MNRLTDALAPLGLILLLLGAWELACRMTGVPAYFLPPPSQVAVAAVEGLPVLVPAAWNTLSVALVALALAAACALALAILVGLSPLIERAVRPLASALQVTPVVAVAPLILIWAGIDHPERAVIALAVLVAFFPIFSGAVTGLRSADPDLERLFDLYGANRLQRVMRLRIRRRTRPRLADPGRREQAPDRPDDRRPGGAGGDGSGRARRPGAPGAGGSQMVARTLGPS